MPIGRPFIDAQAKRGRPVKTTKRISGKIQFGEYNKTQIALYLPNETKPRLVNKEYGIRLAHWLLDKCSR